MRSLTTFAQEESLSQQEMKQIVGGAAGQIPPVATIPPPVVTYIRRPSIIGTYRGKQYEIPDTTVITTNADGSRWAIL
ncbi:hypothetical protein [Spirosoma panaciterrae]|uniref:hypothetical protein n=1 Tax=Spirosoma panaciterrae TaxID=496058 RepID=UPI00035F2175|nr:hypothetical protein [Spirosoma panaciterrae]